MGDSHSLDRMDNSCCCCLMNHREMSRRRKALVGRDMGTEADRTCCHGAAHAAALDDTMEPRSHGLLMAEKL